MALTTDDTVARLQDDDSLLSLALVAAHRYVASILRRPRNVERLLPEYGRWYDADDVHQEAWMYVVQCWPRYNPVTYPDASIWGALHARTCLLNWRNNHRAPTTLPWDITPEQIEALQARWEGG